MPKDHLLAIPVFNEQRYLDGVLAEAGRFSPNILVVNDGSTDRSGELLRRHEGIHIITHPENCGYGQSLVSAFEFAQRNRHDWLITMDCDDQHEPPCIPSFLEAAARDDADIISGTRYPDGYDTDAPAPADRRDINRRITGMINRRLNLCLTDAFCGFKAYRVSALRHLKITVPGYAMPMQLWVQSARAGLRVKELSVRLIYPDPARYFGGVLDDPLVRYRHYIEVFEAELKAGGEVSHPRQSKSGCVPCR